MMLFTMKRNMKFIALAIFILLISYELLLLVFGSPAGYNSSEIQSHIDSYKIVANTLYNDYCQFTTDYLRYIPSNDNAINCITKNSEHIVYLDEDEAIAMNDILNSYYIDKKTLEYITVKDGLVSFSNMNCRAELVYSVNGDAPKSMSVRNNRFKQCRISYIGDGLYFVVELSLK